MRKKKIILGSFSKLNTPTSSESESYTCVEFESKEVFQTIDLTVKVLQEKLLFANIPNLLGWKENIKQ